MGKGFVIKDPQVEIDGQDVSERITSATVNYSAEEVEDNASGKERGRLAGLKDWSIELGIAQDKQAELDGILFDLVGEEDIEIKVRKRGDAISSENPSYEGKGLITGDYSPLAGNVGARNESSVTFAQSDGVALQRVTSSS